MRITLRRAADGEAWDVSWERLRTEALSPAQLEEASRPRLGVVGSWSDFGLQHELTYEGLDGDRSQYSFFVAIGTEGGEAFQLLRELSWDRLIHPDGYVDGAGFAHRVVESLNDGTASDLVWAIGGGSDEARVGEHFRVVVSMLDGKVKTVTWARASRVELDRAQSMGRVLGRG